MYLSLPSLPIDLSLSLPDEAIVRIPQQGCTA